MNPQNALPGPEGRKRRYQVHLSAAQDESTGIRSYVASVRLWSARPNPCAKTAERSFTDECQLVEVLNPLLPKGSDVRDVLGYVEGPDGFIYLLHLTQTEAAFLGWNDEL